MATVSLGRSARRWAGAVLALLACGWLAPASARAGGCALRDHLGAIEAHFDGLVAAGALAATPGHQAPLPGNRPTPCTGLWCSGKSAVPSIPAASTTPRVAESAYLTQRPALPDTGPLFEPSRVDRSRPVRRPLSIFHPPRLA